MKDLTLQNHDLTTQLKGSMARELEWRFLFYSYNNINKSFLSFFFKIFFLELYIVQNNTITIPFIIKVKVKIIIHQNYNHYYMILLIRITIIIITITIVIIHNNQDYQVIVLYLIMIQIINYLRYLMKEKVIQKEEKKKIKILINNYQNY